jgi:integral membrane sensor domain MASE1
MASSCYRYLGFPTGLVPIGFQSNSFLVVLARSILWIRPSHLILCALMNLTISAPSIKLSISMLFHVLHILSLLTGPNIFFNICLSKVRKLFSSSAVTVQVSDEYAMTVLIIVFTYFHFSESNNIFNDL